MAKGPVPSDRSDTTNFDQDVTEATALYRSDDITGAFVRFESLAQSGSPEAMTWLGYMHQNGEGTTVDSTAALHWYSKAAEAGDAEAMRRIGHIYSSGEGVARDRLLAQEWFLKAAQSGDANGQHNLAAMLEAAGESGQAEKWLQKAAAQGYEPSIKSLREQQAYRMIKAKRYVDALPLLSEAAEHGSGWAQAWRGYLHWHGLGTPADRDRSLREYQAAYDSGYHWVANTIGHLHYGAGRFESALEWYRKDTQRRISSLYWQYRVLKKRPDLERSSGERDKLLLEAASGGHARARREVAVRAIKGEQRFGSRLHGLHAWLCVGLHAFHLAYNDEHDERLR